MRQLKAQSENVGQGGGELGAATRSSSVHIFWLGPALRISILVALSAWKKNGVPQRSQRSPAGLIAGGSGGRSTRRSWLRPARAAVISALVPTGLPSRGKLLRKVAMTWSTRRRSVRMSLVGALRVSASGERDARGTGGSEMNGA